MARFLAVFLAPVALRLATVAASLLPSLRPCPLLGGPLGSGGLALGDADLLLGGLFSVVALRFATVAFFWAAFSPPAALRLATATCFLPTFLAVMTFAWRRSPAS